MRKINIVVCKIMEQLFTNLNLKSKIYFSKTILFFEFFNRIKEKNELNGIKRKNRLDRNRNKYIAEKCR